MIDGSRWTKRPVGIADSDALSFGPEHPFFRVRRAPGSLSVAISRKRNAGRSGRHARIRTPRNSTESRHFGRASAPVCLSAEKDLLEDIWQGVFTDMRHALLWG